MTSPRRRAELLVAAALVAGCGGAPSTRPVVPAPAPGPATEEEAPMAWRSLHDRDHPLVGVLWDVAAAAPTSEADLAARALAARFLLLGEQHDNPDHPLLRARMLERLAAAGRRPAVVFEQIDVDRQAAVDAALAEGGDADAVALAAEWTERWGDWELYRPLVAAAVAAGMPIVAGGLPAEQVRAVARGGPEALDPALRARVGLDEPVDEATREAMAAELVAAHCGMIPREAAAAMVPAQRLRDLHLATRLVEAATDDGAVLVAGNGHVRLDRGAGAAVRARRPEDRVLAVGFLEVEPGLESPADYAARFGAERLPFDVVWLTPRASVEDPCEAMRRRMGGEGGGR